MDLCMILFFQLLIGHAVADFVFQSDTMAIAKSRHGQLEKAHGENFPPWYYWLTAHSLIHGGAVYLLTGNVVFGLIETVLHWSIDFTKQERWINFHQDQALHILCKILYCTLI